MWYRAKRRFRWHDQRGQECVINAGQLVDILREVDVERLLAEGTVKAYDVKYEKPTPLQAAQGLAPGRKRIAVMMPSTAWYSGGRIHIFQIAWCLARVGHQVVYVSNNKPAWWDDYPQQETLHLHTGSIAAIPDLDVLLVDGKNPIGRAGEEYAKAHGVPLMPINFETPNWFGKFCPDLVKHIEYHDGYRDLFVHSTMPIANSRESAKYLVEWMGVAKDVAVIPPAVNTYAMQATPLPASLRGRRYCLISGRADGYKHNEVSVAAVMSAPGQVDLVVVGGTAHVAQHAGTPEHRVHLVGKVSDRLKFQLMRDASLVLAPSRFEGFGMVPGEALAVGTLPLCYDLPVLRQEYGDRIAYAKWHDPKDFAEQTHKLLTDKAKAAEDDTAWAKTHLGMDAMCRRVDRVPYLHGGQVRISVVMNAWYCGSTVQHALASVYDHVDEIIVALGREAIWPWPTDDTVAKMHAFPDPQAKLRFVEPPGGGLVWPGRTEDECRQGMRRACCAKVTGNYLLILDGDELWHGLGAYRQALEQRQVQGGCPLGVTFWHNAEHHIISSSLERWGERSQATQWGTVWPHVRLVPWRYSYRWRKHVVPVDAQGQPVWRPEMNRYTVSVLLDRCVLYHLGHALGRRRMTVKKKFYAEVEGQEPQQDAWMKWEGKLGDCGDGHVERVTWQVPDIVQQAFASIAEDEARAQTE